MWAAVFVPSAATVTLSCGTSIQTFSVTAGVNKLKIPLASGKMSVKMVRNGQTIIDYTPSGYTYVTNPVICEYLSSSSRLVPAFGIALELGTRHLPLVYKHMRV